MQYCFRLNLELPHLSNATKPLIKIISSQIRFILVRLSYFYDLNHNRYIDMQHNFFKTVLFFLLSFSMFCLNVSFAQESCSVVIHAISINPGDCNDGVDCDSPSEYIELFNPCFEALELDCTSICEGDWCVTVPVGTVLMPGEYLAIGSATSPGFDADNAAHLDMNNCGGCGWLNPDVEDAELGALKDDEGGQIALFDENGQLLQGLFWGGGQDDFPVVLMLEGTNGCPSNVLNLPDPTTDPEFIALPDVESGCAFSIKMNNEVNTNCLTDEKDIAMGASNLQFLPYTINGCLYTGETITVTLNTEGNTSSLFWTTSPCSNTLMEDQTASVNVICNQPGTKTIEVLALNESNGYTYQYKEEIEILPGLDGVKELQDQEICAGENVNFEIPVLAGLDSQMVVVNNPPNDPQMLTENFVVDIQNIEETSTITFTGFGGGENCSFIKEVTFTVLPVDDSFCSTPVEEYTDLLASAVFPNPAKNFVHLQYELKQNTESTISLYNVFGQKVYEQEILSSAGKNQESIDIEKNPAGVYMLRLALENETVHYKFIKE